MFIIRREESKDRSAIYEINRRAFEGDAEARLVDALRQIDLTCISLVAEAGARPSGISCSRR